MLLHGSRFLCLLFQASHFSRSFACFRRFLQPVRFATFSYIYFLVSFGMLSFGYENNTALKRNSHPLFQKNNESYLSDNAAIICCENVAGAPRRLFYVHIVR